MCLLASQDTDSLFTKDELGLLSKLLDDAEIGKFKDELKGETITEAVFLGVKQYGYTYNSEGLRKERSVFAGAPRNALSFKDIQHLFKGGEITLKPATRFFKSLINLTVKIKPTTLSIRKNTFKELQGNIYLPPVVNLTDNTTIHKRIIGCFASVVYTQLAKQPIKL